MLELDLILINPNTGFSVELFVSPKSTVADVLARLLAVRTSTDPMSRFLYKGTQMENARTLESYGITDKATIHFVERLNGNSRQMYLDLAREGRDIDRLEAAFQGDLPVTIEYAGQEIVFLVDPTILVGYLKLRLEYVTRLPYGQQKLSYPEGRMILEDVGTLQEYGIGEGCVLHLESLTQNAGRRRKTLRKRTFRQN